MMNDNNNMLYQRLISNHHHHYQQHHLDEVIPLKGCSINANDDQYSQCGITPAASVISLNSNSNTSSSFAATTATAPAIAPLFGASPITVVTANNIGESTKSATKIHDGVDVGAGVEAAVQTTTMTTRSSPSAANYAVVVSDLKEQVEKLQRQLVQYKLEIEIKDRTIASLRQQVQKQNDHHQQQQQYESFHLDSQPFGNKKLSTTTKTTPEMVVLSPNKMMNDQSTTLVSTKLDSKLSKYFRNKLFNYSNHDDMVAIQNDVDTEIKQYFQDKFSRVTTPVISTKGNYSGCSNRGNDGRSGDDHDEECCYNDHEDDETDADDCSSSVTSGLEESLHSGLTSITSLSTLQRRCQYDEQIQQQHQQQGKQIDLAQQQHQLNHATTAISSTNCHHSNIGPPSCGAVHGMVEQVQQWLLFGEGGNLNDIPSFLSEFCSFCKTYGGLFHLDRFMVTMVPISPPSYLWTWEDGKGVYQQQVIMPSHTLLGQTKNEYDSFDGHTKELRIRACPSDDCSSIPSGYDWFTEDKYQDYLALPIYHRGNLVGTVAWATKYPNGFSSQDIHMFHETLPALTNVLRLHTQDTMITILEDRLAEQLRVQQTKDVAEAKSANATISKQAQEQLFKRFAMHFAMMSHEIRTPLNCIVGLSNLLLDNPDKPLDPEVEESISMITTSGDLLLAVVDDVLDYSKLATGNVEIDIRPTNIRRTICPVVESIRMKAAAAAATAGSSQDTLQLRTTISDDLPEYIDVDGRRLQQILYNLLGNAIKFGRLGKYVDFTVSVTAHASTTTTTTTDASDETIVTGDDNVETNQLTSSLTSYIVFSIKDYGRGIADKEIKSIFQPFQQASSNDAADGGTGLGLAITNQLCKVLGGSVSVTSEEGHWSEFVVKLPLIESKNIPNLQSANPCNLANSQNTDDKRTTFFRRSQVANAGGSPSRKLTALLSDFHGLNRSFHVVPRKSSRPTLQRSRSDQTCSGSTAPHYTSPKENRQSLFVQKSPREDPPRYPSSTDHPSVPKAPTVPSLLQLTASGIQPTGSRSTGTHFEYIRVLIAEDNLINQKVLTRTLHKLGIRTIDVVANGLEAVNITSEKTYDVIFMDWCMPVMDGLQATKLIVARRRKNLGVSHPKIVFLTAHALEDYREKAAEAGGDGFISKPFKVDAIKEFLGHIDVIQNMEPHHMYGLPDTHQ